MKITKEQLIYECAKDHYLGLKLQLASESLIDDRLSYKYAEHLVDESFRLMKKRIDALLKSKVNKQTKSWRDIIKE